MRAATSSRIIEQSPAAHRARSYTCMAAPLLPSLSAFVMASTHRPNLRIRPRGPLLVVPYVGQKISIDWSDTRWGMGLGGSGFILQLTPSRCLADSLAHSVLG